MKRINAGSRNIGFYAAMCATYIAAMPMVNGALIQLFLAGKGLSTVQIGAFSTVVQLSRLMGTIAFSKAAERSGSPLRSTRLVLLTQVLLYLCYLPVTKLQLSAVPVLLIMAGLAAMQTFCFAYKGILDYKLPYQIIPLERYGSMVFFNSAINGVVGIGLSFCFSQIIALAPMGEPYFWCMVMALLLLSLSYFCSHSMRPIDDTAVRIRKNPLHTRQLLDMFRSAKFRAIIFPTMLRGITFGITESIVLIMLNLGYSDADASKLPIITAFGCLLAAGIYHLLSTRMKMPNIGTFGSLLLLAVLFLPRGNPMLFYALYLVVYTGQMMIDCTIPIMIIQIVDPEIAGAFNAWRNTLLFLVSTGATYVTSVLLSKGYVTVLLVACAAGYVISMILHKAVYYRFTSNHR